MSANPDFERLVNQVCRLDRAQLIAEFERFDGSIPLDFTPEFLRRQPEDRLRHILVALCLQCDRSPGLAA